MKKYELTENKIEVNGVTLYQTRALIDIESSNVNLGDLGGYIEKEENLSHLGNAWVYGNAMVSGDARVSGNTMVSGDARVSGNARVYGNTRVYGNAMVSGDAWVYGNTRVYGNAMVSGDAWVSGNAWVSSDVWTETPPWFNIQPYNIGMCSKTILKIGCQEHTFKSWRKHWKKIITQYDFPLSKIEEYRNVFNMFVLNYGDGIQITKEEMESK